MQIEEDIAKILNIVPKMVRFYAAKMLVELTRERLLTNEEQHRIYNQCSKRRFREVYDAG